MSTGAAPPNILHRETLRRLSGDGSFERGKRYFEEQRVAELVRSRSSVLARVRGSTEYAVQIWSHDDGLAFTCSCPHGQEKAFCKHAVATSLAWLERHAMLPPR